MLAVERKSRRGFQKDKEKSVKEREKENLWKVKNKRKYTGETAARCRKM